MESITINNQSYLINDKYFGKKNKKVSFSIDCKTYDDASHYNNIFALLCKNFFRSHNPEERISNSFGVLIFLSKSDIDDNEKFLDYALNEMNIIVLDLISLSSKILDDNITFNNMFLSKTIETQETSDPFWDKPFFIEMSRKNKYNYKVPVCRKGNRQFSSALGIKNLNDAKVFRNILKESLQWYR
jgi:hypothetical protein